MREKGGIEKVRVVRYKEKEKKEREREKIDSERR